MTAQTARAKVETILADYRHRLAGVVEPHAAVERLWPARKLRTALSQWREEVIADVPSRLMEKVDALDPNVLNAGELKSAVMVYLAEAGGVQ